MPDEPPEWDESLEWDEELCSLEPAAVSPPVEKFRERQLVKRRRERGR